MDIQSLSMDMAQSKVADQVGASMLAKSLKGMDEQGAELLKLLGPVAPLASGSGEKVDTFA
jgi:hypothetical protein